MNHQLPYDYAASLMRLGGDVELFHEIAGMFLEDSPKLVEQARSGLAAYDGPTLERAAHSLKGLSANFSATATSTAAAAVEQFARQQQWSQAAESLAQLENHLARLQQALADHNAELDTNSQLDAH